MILDEIALLSSIRLDIFSSDFVIGFSLDVKVSLNMRAASTTIRRTAVASSYFIIALK